MSKKIVQTAAAPRAIGPYSQAVVGAGLVFCSGQIPLDPATGQVLDGDATAQTVRVMENLRAVLAAAGCTFADVLKATVYLKDLSDFSDVNAAYGTYFAADPPARATVEVSRLPRDVRVEIELVAAAPG